MAIYEYKAIDKFGKSTVSRKEAYNEQELFKSLKKEGLTPIRAKQVKVNKGSKYKKQNIDISTFSKIANIEITKQKITSKELAILTRQMYTMLNAGINIINTLEIVLVQIENKRLKKAMTDVLIELKKGFALSTCLRLHSDVFPTLFISVVEAGELTGNISGVLESLAQFYENDWSVEAKVKKATLYPKVIAFVTTTVIILLLMFVVPAFIQTFDSVSSDLPKVTQSLIDVSEFITSHFFAILCVIVLIFIGIGQIKKYETTKYYYDFILNKIPFVNSCIVKINTARFSKTFATLLNSGIPVVSALKSAAAVTGNTVIIRGINSITNEIKNGQNLSVMINSLNYFPPIMVSMLQVGEETGDIVSLLEKTSDYYNNEMNEAVDTLTGLIEPVMIVILALIVGYVAIAILIPVLDMAKTVS